MHDHFIDQMVRNLTPIKNPDQAHKVLRFKTADCRRGGCLTPPPLSWSWRVNAVVPCVTVVESWEFKATRRLSARAQDKILWPGLPVVGLRVPPV